MKNARFSERVALPLLLALLPLADLRALRLLSLGGCTAVSKESVAAMRAERPNLDFSNP